MQSGYPPWKRNTALMSLQKNESIRQIWRTYHYRSSCCKLSFSEKAVVLCTFNDNGTWFMFTEVLNM